MLYAHQAPSGITWSVAGDSSPTFETDVRFDNGQPSEQTVISGVGKASPTTADYIDLRADWSVPQPLHALVMLMLSCVAGVRIEATGRRLGDSGYARALGGNSDARTAALPDGRVQRIILTEATETDYIGLQLRIYNDADGVAWADDETDLLIGETRPFGAVILPRVQAARARGRSNRTLTERASNAAIQRVRRAEYRSHKLTVFGTMAECYQCGLPGGVDWETLQELQDGDDTARVLSIPRRLGSNGQIDYDLCHRTAIYGVAHWGEFRHIAGPEMQCGLDIEEAM